QNEEQNKEQSNALAKRATQLSQTALDIAQKTGDQASQSLALGFLGQQQEKAEHWDEALSLTRQARFAAQGAQAPHLLFRWEWQTGRLLKKKGAINEAVGSYRRAVETLRTLCDCAGVAGLGPDFGDASPSSFRETIGPLYYELADLLLQRTDTLQGAGAVQINLIQARDTIELLKSAELQDYFQDNCVAAGRAKIRDLSSVLQGAAAVYYIPLPDRTEILLDSAKGLQRFTAPVGAAALTSRIRRLRLQLERPTSDRYLAYSQELYDLLVRPIEAALREQKIKTLVFVPDGSLRTIPMSVLHDGRQFVIEKWAVAVTPGLSLMDPQPLARQGSQVLAVGISDSVQGYDALSKVPEELKNIQQNYGSKELLNRDFVRSAVQQQMTEGNFAIIHIASHGEFTSDAKRSYLLTYDSKLSLNDLENVIRPRQYQGTPVELLVLSACQTAAGDDRAALGLAGIAIKSGARSALASLWSVSDEATADLMAQFYTTLKQQNTISKAVALQEAQVHLLKDPRYNHPAYWAPYLIIGNWL
ncbi:MAG TPA: CHAT domain-containing protein, partial [Abditibacteriaceae bacterium]